MKMHVPVSDLIPCRVLYEGTTEGVPWFNPSWQLSLAQQFAHSLPPGDMGERIGMATVKKLLASHRQFNREGKS